MWRHPFYILLLILPALARAGFDATPTWERPRDERDVAYQCWSGVVERLAARGVTGTFGNPTEPSFWRTKRAVLVSCKQRTVQLTSSATGNEWWFDKSCATNGAYMAGYLSTNGYPPYINYTSVLVRANLPTNYWDYTPWRSLMGLGANTNDDTVGHPYGEQNAYTLAGGTNFPPGRTNWYTTDYGWAGITSALSWLVMSRPRATAPAYGDQRVLWGIRGGGSGFWGYDYSVAQDDVEIDYTNAPSDIHTLVNHVAGVATIAEAINDFGTPAYQDMYMINKPPEYRVQMWGSNAPVTVQVYLKAGPYTNSVYGPYSIPPSNAVFSAQNCTNFNISTNLAFVYEQYYASPVEGDTNTITFGNTNEWIAPTWPSTPDTNLVPKSVGWELQKGYVIHYYDFEYK